MILGKTEIQKRLDAGVIFRQQTWAQDCIKEASYALRVAKDGMVFDGKAYAPGGGACPEWPITLEPGRLATMSTVERLCMPGDLVGKLGIRLEFAAKGLTGLMGIQVDPFYGADKDDERLFIRVANFGNENIEIAAEDAVFNIEFSKVHGADKPAKPKESTWSRVLYGIAGQERSDFSYVTRVQTNLNQRANEIEGQLSKDVEGIRNNQQSVVMFGVFLVAVSILGVILNLLFSAEKAPDWVDTWGWILLFALFSIAALAVTGFVVVAGVVFWRSQRNGTPKERG